MQTLEFNTLGSASHDNLFDHIPGPLASGAAHESLTLTETGQIVSSRQSREPMLLLRLKRSLTDSALRISLILDPGGDNEPLPYIHLAPYTEHGAALPAYVPPVDATTRQAPPFAIALTAVEISAEGAETNIPTTDLSDLIEGSLVEGIIGRISYILGSENLRLRRISRELLAMRCIASARDAGLDRIGASLGVPRFTDEIDFDAESGEIVTRSEDAEGHPVVESDADYRRRLDIYQPFLLPSKRNLLNHLNGSGPSDMGALSTLGSAVEFGLSEEDNPFAVAIHLISTGSDEVRINFLNYLRATLLIAPSQALENERYLSTSERTRQAELRARLTESFQFAEDHFIAPELATAMDMLARCRKALLGSTLSTRQVRRAQNTAGGSRYELGLGLDLQPLTQTERNALRDRLLDPERPAEEDTQVEGLLRRMAAMPPPTVSEDPDGRWFLEACGMRTVHRINSQRLYLSHLPTSGLVVQADSQVAPNDEVDIEGHYHAPGDPGGNALLVTGLDRAVNAWVAEGEDAWTVLTRAHAVDRWHNAETRAEASTVFLNAGLPDQDSIGTLPDRLERVPSDLVATLELPPAQAAAILANSPGAADQLSRLKDVLAAAGLVSLLPLVSAPDRIVLVCAVIGLPGIGSNLAPRRAAGFRWYVVPIQGLPGKIGSIGTRNRYLAGRETPALAAIVTVGYARSPDRTDPYEFRVELPDDARLNLRQYEFLMNLLMHSHPLGVEVNTWQIRQHHVDLDDDGTANPLSPSIMRTFRRFRRRRHRGEFGVGIPE